MARSNSKRHKKSYVQQLISQPILVGKWPLANDRAHHVNHRRPFYIAAFVFILQTFAFAGVIYGIYGFAQNPSIETLKPLGLFTAVFLIMSLFSVLYRKTCRCQLCRAAPLVDGKSRKHEKAFKIRPLTYGATACLTILFTNRFRCQHCGTPFILKSNKNKQE